MAVIEIYDAAGSGLDMTDLTNGDGLIDISNAQVHYKVSWG